MGGGFRDFYKLGAVIKESGLRHGLRFALLALRARIMRQSDQKRESSLGVETRENVELDSLDVASENKRHGFSFVPSSGRMVRVMLGSLPSDFRNFTFVDFGSGEGRVLLVAAMFPFREVIGVEFAKELHEVAVRNISKIAQPAAPGRVRSLHVDAAQFDIPSNECVLYFYNPFSEHIFRQVLQNIERAHSTHRKKIYVLYQAVAGELETDKTNNVRMLREANFLSERQVRFPTLWDRFLLGSHELNIFETRS